MTAVQPPPPPAPPTSVSDIQRSNVVVRLLIVDDDPVIRLILDRHFTARGFAVSTASDGAEALRLLSRMRHDLVISDLIMPGMDGLELLRAIRQEYPLLRVVMMTGAVTLDNMLNILKEGAFTFVTKPLDDLAALEVSVDLALAVVQGWLDQLGILHRMKKNVSLRGDASPSSDSIPKIGGTP